VKLLFCSFWMKANCFGILKDLSVISRADLFYCGQFAFAFLSALLYAGHVPERLSKPGRFDLVGQSHQLFHLAAVACTWFQFQAIRLDMAVNPRGQANPGLQSCSVILFSLGVNCIIFVSFYFKAKYSNPWRQEQ